MQTGNSATLTSLLASLPPVPRETSPQCRSWWARQGKPQQLPPTLKVQPHFCLVTNWARHFLWVVVSGCPTLAPAPGTPLLHRLRHCHSIPIAFPSQRTHLHHQQSSSPPSDDCIRGGIIVKLAPSISTIHTHTHTHRRFTPPGTLQ